MRNNLPYHGFSSAGFFKEDQLRTMHRNLGHPSVEMQIPVIENAKVDDLNVNTMEILKKLPTVARLASLRKQTRVAFCFLPKTI